MLACLLLSIGCTSPPEPPGTREDGLSEVIQDGISIPRFSTAADQLNYAKSGLKDKKRKLAAFRAVQTLFSEDREACGQAALGLAYLHLEPQYRFASPREIQLSANDFSSLTRTYKDLPGIRAKALWYLGWIHTELQKDPDTGIGYYWQLVNTLAFVPMNLSPTAPWVNLVYGASATPKAPKATPPKTYWAQVALLEIVRNSPEKEETLRAFDRLMAHYPSTQTAGLALKHMLADPALAAHAREAMGAYLGNHLQNPYLAKDIQGLAEAAVP